MKIGIFSNVVNGIGLQKDAELLQRFLVSEGHVAELVQYDQPCAEKYDLGIAIETFNQDHVPQAARWWYIANPEWLKPELVRPIQRHCEKVLAKTRDAERSLRSLFANCLYVGFLAEDRRDASVVRLDKALHCGGNSGIRGTSEVISAWREYRYYDDRVMPELVVISNSKMVDRTPTPGVVFHKRVTDEELVQLQNECRFHIMPSRYEGFGQSLHESQSVGAVILTTGAGPMAELDAPFTVPSHGTKPYNLGDLQEVWARDIRALVPEMLAQPNHEIARFGMEARSRFVRGNEAFKTAFAALLEPKVASIRVGEGESTQKPRIAILGNFRPPHSTENDLLWSLNDLGYPTLPFQEDEDRTDQILKECVDKDARLLIYVHTHGWSTPGHISLDDLWKELQSRGTRTCSFHLDRYWGLNEADGREDRIGTHAFWRTEKIFTADGGNQERFAERLGPDKHDWLPPGVVRRDCIPGQYDKELASEVGFVGADSYHPEYPFRARLIEFLRAVYGGRFRLYQGYRGGRLNDVYASCRVLVGDSCFAGEEKYWSDRVPETTGRGGFLIHAATEGLAIPGVVTFEPGNLHQLQDRIDWYLEHEEARQACQKAAWLWVRENETYTNRMTTLLMKMGIK